MADSAIDNLLVFGEKKIFCVKGDIIDSKAQAIVNAANNHLWMGSGVAGAIKGRGGQKIEDEAIKRGPIKIGEAIATTGGNLAVKYVIHAAVMGQDLRTSGEYIRSATISSLQQAEKLRLASIDFPALGTGVGNFPIDECGKLMVTEAVLFLKSSKHVKSIGFVLYDYAAYMAFVATLKSLKAII
jgi:O-acetyl-ADP-ribose deacetylase